MNDWTADPQTLTVATLTLVSPEKRHMINAGPTDAATHQAWFDALPVLRETEVGGASPKRPGIRGPARVLAWNVERLRHVDAIADTTRGIGADVLLFCEVDRGMARSGNRDCIADFAGLLDLGYAYGVEFVELGLGDPDEAAANANTPNRDGLHGAAILSDAAMEQPFLIRVERRSDWFDGARGQRRVGSRIAVGARVIIDDVPVLMVNVHLESHSGPTERAAEMRVLLSQIEAIHPDGAVLIGGDFNTSTMTRAKRESVSDWQAELADEPMRLLRPHAHEPLFAVATEFGYDWQSANVPDAPTVRYPAGITRPLGKIDWFFTRGLMASDPQVIPAVLPDGTPSSDHEGIVVTVQPLSTN